MKIKKSTWAYTAQETELNAAARGGKAGTHASRASKTTNRSSDYTRCDVSLCRTPLLPCIFAQQLNLENSDTLPQIHDGLIQLLSAVNTFQELYTCYSWQLKGFNGGSIGSPPLSSFHGTGVNVSTALPDLSLVSHHDFAQLELACSYVLHQHLEGCEAELGGQRVEGLLLHLLQLHSLPQLLHQLHPQTCLGCKCQQKQHTCGVSAQQRWLFFFFFF